WILLRDDRRAAIAVSPPAPGGIPHRRASSRWRVPPGSPSRSGHPANHRDPERVQSNQALTGDVMKCRAIVCASVILFGFAPRVAQASTCSDLAHLTLPTTTITAAVAVPAGTFKPSTGPVPPGSQALYARLPEFCRVAATLRPSADSDIKIEVWLPTQWNGRFQ